MKTLEIQKMLVALQSLQYDASEDTQKLYTDVIQYINEQRG